MSGPHVPRWLVGALVAAALGSGCGTRTHRDTVFHEDRTRVELRHESRGGEVVEKGFSHPVVIAPVRLAHVLSSIDLREGGSDAERRPAIPPEILLTVARGVAQALARAGADQEVAVLAIRNTKRFGLFDRNYLTSFVTYAKGEQLYVHMSRSDWEVPRKKQDRLPQPRLGEQVMRFRLLPARGLSLVDTQSVAADWRDPVFSRPTRARIRADGEVVRRTILMESPEEPVEPPRPEPLPAHLSPAALRELADLEEQRRRGEITDSYFEARRREIIEADGGAP